ncbi:hypothetical protein TIFTF001_056119, partial [Ficus carica]
MATLGADTDSGIDGITE